MKPEMRGRLAAEIEHAKEAAPDGVTIAELSEMMGIATNAIYKAIRRLGIQECGNFGTGHEKLYSEDDAKKVIYEIMSRRRSE